MSGLPGTGANIHMRIYSLAILAAFATQAIHAADTPASIKSAIFVERANLGGQMDARMVERASTLAAGDRVVTILDWRAPGGKQASTVTLAVPRHLAFQRSSVGDEEISIDGGRNWGKLGALRMRDGDGVRLASPEDVTNVRWRVRGTNGRITYSAVVR